MGVNVQLSPTSRACNLFKLSLLMPGHCESLMNAFASHICTNVLYAKLVNYDVVTSYVTVLVHFAFHDNYSKVMLLNKIA